MVVGMGKKKGVILHKKRTGKEDLKLHLFGL